MNDRTRTRTVQTIGVVILVGWILVASVAAIPTPQPNQTEYPHTIEIIQKNGTVRYTVSLPGAYSLEQTEKGDVAAGHNVHGRVGPPPWEKTTDKRDVIHYEGELQDLEINDANGAIRVKIDGKSVDPQSLHNTPTGPPPTVTGTITATPTDEPTSTAEPTPTESSQATTTDAPVNTGQSAADQPTETPSPTGGDSDSGWSLLDIGLAIGVAVVVLSVFFRWT